MSPLSSTLPNLSAEARALLIPPEVRRNVVQGLFAYGLVVFGLAKTGGTLAFSKLLPLLGYSVPVRTFGGGLVIGFLLLTIYALWVFRRVAARSLPAVRGIMRSWVLQGAMLFVPIGIVAAALDAVLMAAVVPALNLSLGAEQRGLVAAAVMLFLYSLATWISYRWAKRSI